MSCQEARYLIVGRAHKPRDAECLLREHGVDIACPIEDCHGIADREILPHRHIGAHHAFIVCLRPRTAHKLCLVHGGGALRGTFRQGGDPHRVFIIVERDHRIAGEEGHHILDALGIPYLVHLAVSEAERRDKADIVERRIIVVGIPCQAHVAADHVEAGKEAAAERDNTEDCEEASPRP